MYSMLSEVSSKLKESSKTASLCKLRQDAARCNKNIRPPQLKQSIGPPMAIKGLTESDQRKVAAFTAPVADELQEQRTQ